MFGQDRLSILDTVGTTVDAFSAINRAFLFNDVATFDFISHLPPLDIEG